MADRLVTIATFDQPPKAQLARNALTAAGIQATISDESLVAMDWLLSNAVGGVKVQVWEDDAERAVAVLESEFGEDGAGFGPAEGIDPDELAAEAESADADEEPDRPGTTTLESTHTNELRPPAAPDGREEDARRMVFAAILGLMFWPVIFYALYLFLNAAFGEGELSSRGRLNLLIGGGIIVAVLTTGSLVFGLFI